MDFASIPRPRQARGLAPHLPRGFLCQRRAGRDEQGLRIGTVFGLREQIGGDEIAAGGVIRNHHDLGHAGGQVGGRARGVLRDQHFGGGHEGIARPENFVALGYGRRAVGHGGDGLSAARLEHLIDAGLARGDQHRRIGGAVARGRRAHHPHRAAGDGGGNREHDGGGRQRGGTRRHIQPDRTDGNADALAEHPRRGLHTQRRRGLRGMELPHIVDRPFNRGDLHSVQGSLGIREFLRRHAQRVRAHTVELFREGENGAVALAAHRIDDASDRLQGGFGVALRRAPQRLIALRGG